MATEYPDILGDLVEARERFEVNGVHYMVALEPAQIAPGEATTLRLWLQSCWDVPTQVAVSVHPPTEGLSLIQRQTDVPLQAGEVGELCIPIASAAGLQDGQGRLDDPDLSFTTGMGLAASMGLGFLARTQPERELTLRVAGPPQPLSPPDLTPTFVSLWTVDDLLLTGRARRYVYDQKVFFLPQMTRQALFTAFLDESQLRYKNAGVRLHIGEAVFAAKILTFAVEHFLQRPDWQDAILLPAYTLAYRYDLPVLDPVSLVARADYARLTRLACSLSFGLLRQRLQRDVWSLKEQMAVTDLVADRVGEKVAQSRELLARARQKRQAKLAENPQLGALLDQLLYPSPS